MPKTMSIGTLAKQTGVKVPTIRYYESVDLLPVADRTDSNRRTYGADDARRVRFIRHARELGFDIHAVRQLLGLGEEPDRPCHEADAIARAHLMDIDQKITRLGNLRSEVQRMVDQCAQGRIRECRVIEALADDGECLDASRAKNR